MVQLATHRTQASLDVAQALAVGELSKGHGQILVAAREVSVVRIPAITLDTLLELVGGQVLHQLSEDSLAGIHPSLSTIGSEGGYARSAFSSLKTIQIEKTEDSPSLLIKQWLSTLGEF